MGCNDSPDKLARQVLTVFRRNDPQFLDAATSEYGNSVTRCRTLAGAGVLQRAMRRGWALRERAWADSRVFHGISHFDFSFFLL